MNLPVVPTGLPPKAPTQADQRIGERVAARRKLLGLSQTALGQAVGVTFQQMQKYETGRNRIGAGRLQAMAAVLGVPVAALFDQGGEEVGEDSLGSLALPGASELLRLFARIPRPDQRRSLIAIARTLTEVDPPAAAAE